MKKFSAIVPAYNEWPRIANVLKILLECEKLTEIIVVDDGSTDHTKSEIEKFENPKIQKIFKEKNAGKSRAIMDGVLASNSEYIVMVDSDLIGLEGKNISDLISPIENNLANTSLSIRRDSMAICRLCRADFLSGDRVLPREIFIKNQNFFTEWKWYGLEVKLNKKILENNWKIANVMFENVSAPDKRAKYGWWQGVKKDLKMQFEVLKTIWLFGFVKQFFLFSRFSSRTRYFHHRPK